MPSMMSPVRHEPMSQRLWWVSYVVAVIAVLVAMVLRELLAPVLQRAIFLPFILAIVVSGWYGGFGPGLLATALGVLTMALRMPPPGNALAYTAATDMLVLGLFGLAGLCISVLTGQLHQARRRAEAEVAARQQAEVAAHTQRERFEVTLGSIGDAVIATDSQGRVTFLNAVAVALTGWSQAEALGQDITEVFPIINEYTREAVEPPIARVLRDGTVVGLANHTLLIARDGVARPIDDSGAPIHDTQGRLVGVVLVFRDITERRRAEAVRTRLAAIVESSDDAIISKTLDGIITSWNQGAERLYGYTAAEVVGQPIALLIPPDMPDDLQEIMARLRRGERIDHYETQRLAKDGTRLDVSLTISPLRDGAGQIIGASAIARDITARKRDEVALQQAHADLEQRVEERTAALQREMAERQRLEQEAQRAEHFALLGRLAAGVSHEIRNPLGAIFLHVELLEAEWHAPSPDSVQHITEALAEIKTNLSRLEDLVQDYLSLVRVSTIQRDVQPLGPTVQAWADEWQRLANARCVTLRCKTLEALGEVAFHHNTLQRALLNLVQNALDAMPSGGTLTLAGNGTATQAHLSIQDTGSGIPAERWQQIFEPLYTTKPGGTGLGLYIVQEIVTAHAGQVTVHSRLGQGTTFTITLPRPAPLPP